MTKTQNYNLNKPEGGDPLRLADFNQNSDILDAALSNLNVAMGALNYDHIVTGSFSGTGVAGRTVELGVTPKFVLLMTKFDNEVGASITICTDSFGGHINGYGVGLNDSRTVTNGVYISSTTNNSKVNPNYYVAFV